MRPISHWRDRRGFPFSFMTVHDGNDERALAKRRRIQNVGRDELVRDLESYIIAMVRIFSNIDAPNAIQPTREHVAFFAEVRQLYEAMEGGGDDHAGDNLGYE